MPAERPTVEPEIRPVQKEVPEKKQATHRISAQVFDVLLTELDAIRRHEAIVRIGWLALLLVELPTFALIVRLPHSSPVVLGVLVYAVAISAFIADWRRRMLLRRSWEFQENLLRRLDPESQDKYVSFAHDFRFVERFSLGGRLLSSDFYWLGAINCLIILGSYFARGGAS